MGNSSDKEEKRKKRIRRNDHLIGGQSCGEAGETSRVCEVSASYIYE